MSLVKLSLSISLLEAFPSERQQMRASSVFYQGMFNFTPFILPEVVVKKSEISEESIFYTSLKSFMGDNDFICNSVNVNSQEYRTGDIVVLDIIDSDNISVGIVQTILIKKDLVYFVLQRFSAIRNILQYFESEGSGQSSSEFVQASKLKDFKPLIKRGTTKKFVFVLHHHLSFMYR